MISAPKKSSGKTIISLGILNNFISQGKIIQSFKKGPDYIDPMWLSLASKKECYNLDPYLMGEAGCLDSFIKYGSKTGSVLIEGNHGLHDGMSLDGSDSSAGLANLLDSPVLLVLNSMGMNRGAAAIVKGMQKMSPEPNISGVILNNVRSLRQEDKQKLAIETHCNVPVLGAIPREEEVNIPERNLGLTTVEEMKSAEEVIKYAGELVKNFCDIDSIESLFKEDAYAIDWKKKDNISKKELSVKIGVFNDPAFCFYYPENLEALKIHGAKIYFINSLNDSTLPDLDGIYIGGGFPESFFDELTSNYKLLEDINERVKSGLPVYAECGGLIYLSQYAHFKGEKYKMAGVLPFEIGYQKNPVGYGYVSLKSRFQSRWFEDNTSINAHEFHYSRPLFIEGVDKVSSNKILNRFQFDVIRGYGIDGKKDGILHENVFASFAHLHSSANPEWAKRFVKIASEYRH
tara:strand:- start:2753 stop:4132 length:1380 start_codon:yes stop_codon:yes gene_type:complete